MGLVGTVFRRLVTTIPKAYAALMMKLDWTSKFYHGGGAIAMTNEELAAMAKDGDRDALLMLWSQVRRLAWSQLKRWAWARQPAGMEPGDSESCALMALWMAVASFDPGKGAFSTWFTVHLRKCFFEFAGLRTEKQSSDPLRTAGSLDVPGTPDASEDLCLADIIPDPAAEAPFLASDLEAAIEEVLAELPPDQRKTIRDRYWGDGSVDPRAHAEALRALRHPSRSRRLRKFWRG